MLTVVVAMTGSGCGGPTAPGTALWPMYHLDPARSGRDTREPSFANLHSAWSSGALDGDIYAEPLIDGNLVIVATQNNSLYAFNAGTGAPQWGPVNLGPPRTLFPPPCGNLPSLGILGTPLIDGGFLYVVANIQVTPVSFEWDLFQVHPVTGAVARKTNITPSAVAPPGGSRFDTEFQQQRSALALSKGNLVVTWGALSQDCSDFHGFVETISEATGIPQAQWNDTFEANNGNPPSAGGGIWGTSGAAVDSAGNIYVSTGNGAATDPRMYSGDYGDSVLQFSPSLALKSFFAPGLPEAWWNSNQFDVDLGSLGPSLLPGGMLFAIGKGGEGYLLRQSGLPNNSNPGGGENHQAPVCSGVQDQAYGGLAVSGNRVFVPCSDGLVAVSIDSSSAFHNLWYTKLSGGAAPPILAGGLVWTLETFGGDHLYGLRPDSGAIAATFTLPTTTDHFASPAAGDGMLFVGDGNRVAAFAPSGPRTVSAL